VTFVCSVAAVVFSVWSGLHYGTADAAAWMTIYGAIAGANAALPAGRWAGFVGLAVAAGAVAWGAFLMQGGWTLSGLVDGGGPVTPARETLMFVVGVLWLSVGSALRMLKT
jgi:hypothetical protein